LELASFPRRKTKRPAAHPNQASLPKRTKEPVAQRAISFPNHASGAQRHTLKSRESSRLPDAVRAFPPLPTCDAPPQARRNLAQPERAG